MQFLYNQKAGDQEILVCGDDYKYLFKVRRFKVGESLNIQNLKDQYLYKYKIIDIEKKEALLKLEEKSEVNCKVIKDFHLIWCVIDNKIIEKTLPMLNQLGLKMITFVYCDRSQRNFKIDINRIEKILINSSQQCGRNEIMKIEVMQSLDEVFIKYKNISILDFNAAKEWSDVTKVLIGCEGGFSEQERNLFEKYRKISLKTELILKSETAAVAICSKLLI